MPRLVHIAPEADAAKIRRNGIRARREKDWIDGHDKFVWAFPVLESYTLTHQWMRELKRRGFTTLTAFTIKIPDKELVFVRHFSQAPCITSAVEAVHTIRSVEDPRGYEIIIPRRIAPSEIVAARTLPRAIGWRYYPDAKNQPMKTCDCPYCLPRGEVKAARYRGRVTAAMRRAGLVSTNAYNNDDDERPDQS